MLDRTTRGRCSPRQIGAIVLSIVACVLMQDDARSWRPAAAVAARAGRWLLRVMRDKRRRSASSAQLDGWLLVLSNALKPRRRSARRSTASAEPHPAAAVAQELDLVLKEVRGSAPRSTRAPPHGGAGQAARPWGARRSRCWRRARRPAATCAHARGGGRHPARDGAPRGRGRTKTAEGRAQAAVIAVAPLRAGRAARLDSTRAARAALEHAARPRASRGALGLWAAALLLGAQDHRGGRLR